MRALLISPNMETISMPVHPVGIYLVAEAAARQGHDIRVLDMLVGREPISELRSCIKDFEPEVIGISVRNIDNQDMDDPVFFLGSIKKIISVIKEITSVAVVLGGAGYTMFARSALSYLQADMGIAGEGEIAFPMLLQALERGNSLRQIPGLYLPYIQKPESRFTIRHLNSCPLPSPEWVDKVILRDSSFWLPYQTRRGCPLGCSYCSTANIEGRLIRKRDIGRMAENIKLWQQSGVTRFFFVDNTFNLPPSYAVKLCKAIIDEGLDIAWRCILYPRQLSYELVRLMAQAGCSEVSLGFESGSPVILSDFKKHFCPEDIKRCSYILAKEGIKQRGFLLLGGPKESKETVEDSLAFIDSLHLDSLKLTCGIRIYPKTPLARQAQLEKFVRPGDDLLYPKFYLRPALHGWLSERIDRWAGKRPELIAE